MAVGRWEAAGAGRVERAGRAAEAAEAAEGKETEAAGVGMAADEALG